MENQLPKNPIFNGSDYVPALDNKRLTTQMHKIFNLMSDGQFRTLSDIEQITGEPQASISAQLRHLRKPRFGQYIVNKRRSGELSKGLFEYQVVSRQNVGTID